MCGARRRTLLRRPGDVSGGPPHLSPSPGSQTHCAGPQTERRPGKISQARSFSFCPLAVLSPPPAPQLWVFCSWRFEGVTEFRGHAGKCGRAWRTFGNVWVALRGQLTYLNWKISLLGLLFFSLSGMTCQDSPGSA